MPTTQSQIDDTARKAHEGVEASERFAHKAVSRIAEKAAEWRDDAAPVLNRASERAEDWARQGKRWVQDGSDRVRTEVTRASDRTVGYMRDEPVKSVLMAAAAGALLYAVVRLLSDRTER